VKPKNKRRNITEKLNDHDQQILNAIYSQMSSTGKPINVSHLHHE